MTWGTTRKGVASYSFVYDKLNRLKEAVSGNNLYNEYVGYSNMGNITKLGRWANIGGSREQIDSLTYSYSANQLRDVVDQVTGTYGYVDNGISDINDIRYDANGNISKDLNRGITEYNYTYLNLPGLITFSNGTELDFDYERQSGVKVKKRFVNGTTVTTTDYVDGIQYETVTGNSPQLTLIQTDEGRIRKNGTGYVYEYDLKDHLGNVRVTVQPSSDSAKVVQENSYYAFGMDMPGMGFVDGTSNQYLYNGKEKQEELFGQYDYGARFYDPVIGRWNVIDPSAENDESQSPYNYVFNNPILLTDPDGRWPDLPSLHTALDVAGLVPGLGEIADGANALIYLAEGNKVDAALSAAAMIPLAGTAATAAKFIRKADKAVDAAKATSALAKAEARAAKLSKVDRPGKDFTKAGKEAVVDINKAKNGGKTVCVNCKTETTAATKDKKGVTPSKNRTEVDHVERKRDGGSGTPKNGQVLCRGCNAEKH